MSLRKFAVVCSLCGVVSAAPVAAQGLPPGTTVSDASLSALFLFDTGLDSGGNFSWGSARAAGTLLRQFTPQWAAGIAISYEYQNWTFNDPVAFGGTSPWSDINRPRVAATFLYRPAEDWVLALIPSVGWSFERGASTSDALEYGAVVTAAKIFSPRLTLGLGAAVFHQIYQTKAFPFPVIDWQIDEHWKITNPFEAGPAGGAGVEVVYAFNDRWELAGGGSYRSYVFRLSKDGPVGNGIGENNFVPVFLRATYNAARGTRLDFYVAALTGGKLTVKNALGNDLTNDSYKTAPALGMTLQSRF
ncbi:MAG: hypothetical protein ABI607_04575 [Betaproteobacteria bacterium]